MIVLDTNVVSELMKPAPSEAVVAWMDNAVDQGFWLTAISLADLLYGIGRLPDGRRKEGLADQLAEMIVADLDRRVLAFDESAAAQYADIVVNRERLGRPISHADAQIAAICRTHDAGLATRNVGEFAGIGLRVLNPWS